MGRRGLARGPPAHSAPFCRRGADRRPRRWGGWLGRRRPWPVGGPARSRRPARAAWMTAARRRSGCRGSRARRARPPSPRRSEGRRRSESRARRGSGPLPRGRSLPSGRRAPAAGRAHAAPSPAPARRAPSPARARAPCQGRRRGPSPWIPACALARPWDPAPCPQGPAPCPPPAQVRDLVRPRAAARGAWRRAHAAWVGGHPRPADRHRTPFVQAQPRGASCLDLHKRHATGRDQTGGQGVWGVDSGVAMRWAAPTWRPVELARRWASLVGRATHRGPPWKVATGTWCAPGAASTAVWRWRPAALAHRRPHSFGPWRAEAEVRLSNAQGGQASEGDRHWNTPRGPRGS